MPPFSTAEATKSGAQLPYLALSPSSTPVSSPPPPQASTSPAAIKEIANLSSTAPCSAPSPPGTTTSPPFSIGLPIAPIAAAAIPARTPEPCGHAPPSTPRRASSRTAEPIIFNRPPAAGHVRPPEHVFGRPSPLTDITLPGRTIGDHRHALRDRNPLQSLDSNFPKLPFRLPAPPSHRTAPPMEDRHRGRGHRRETDVPDVSGRSVAYLGAGISSSTTLTSALVRPAASEPHRECRCRCDRSLPTSPTNDRRPEQPPAPPISSTESPSPPSSRRHLPPFSQPYCPSSLSNRKSAVARAP